ncbi:MAG: DNA methylase [Desulfobulbaceae bacterium]|nr:DNA methylase [Desulfobulbaceae bacterium]
MDSESRPGDALPMGENRLARLETIIHKHRRQFYQSGLALKQIRDERLYRDALFDNFDAYVRQRWDMHRSHAYRLIQAATVMDNLSPIGDGILPQNESQARVLARENKDEQRRLWRGFVSSGMALNAANIRTFIRSQKKAPAAQKSKTAQLVEIVSAGYKATVMAMLEQIRRAKNDAWQTTSKQAALFWVKVMKEHILTPNEKR